MVFFVDFEFDYISKNKIDILSIGSTNGSVSFYGELPLKQKWGSNFVEDSVVPLLGLDESVVYEDLNSLTLAFKNWLKANNFKPMIICDSDYDKELLVSKFDFDSSFISVISKNIIENEMYSFAHDNYFDPITKPQHNALNDAHAIMAGYYAVVGKS